MENRAIEPDSALPHTFAILSLAIEEFRGNAPSSVFTTALSSRLASARVTSWLLRAFLTGVVALMG